MPSGSSSFAVEHGRSFTEPLVSLLDSVVGVGVNEGDVTAEDVVWDCKTVTLKPGGTLPVRRKESSESASRPNQGSVEAIWVSSIKASS